MLAGVAWDLEEEEAGIGLREVEIWREVLVQHLEEGERGRERGRERERGRGVMRWFGDCYEGGESERERERERERAWKQ